MEAVETPAIPAGQAQDILRNGLEKHSEKPAKEALKALFKERVENKPKKLWDAKETVAPVKEEVTVEQPKEGEDTSTENVEDAKEQKENERFERNWKKLNEDRETLKKEREELDKYKQEIESYKTRKQQEDMEKRIFIEELNELRQFKQQVETRPDYVRLDPQEFRKMAESHEELADKAMEEGDFETAKHHRAEAKKLKSNASELESRLKEYLDKDSQSLKMKYAQRQENLQKLLAKRPELNDANNPVTQLANDILRGGFKAEDGTFNDTSYVAKWLNDPSNVHGEQLAVQFADLLHFRKGAKAQIDELNAKLEKLEKEKKEMTAKLSVGNSYATAGKGNKSYNEMTPEEQKLERKKLFATQFSTKFTD